MTANFMPSHPSRTTSFRPIRFAWPGVGKAAILPSLPGPAFSPPGSQLDAAELHAV